MLLLGRESERLSRVWGCFWSGRPLRSRFSLRATSFSEQSQVCGAHGLRQHVPELLRQDKRRNVPAVSDS